MQIQINQKVIKNFCMGVVRNGCEQCSHWTLKLAVSQEWIDGTKLIFCKVVQIQESKKYPNDFLGGSGQKWERSFSSWGPKINKFMDWTDFLHADCDAIIFY